MVRVCFQGARIRDVEERIEQLAKSCGEWPLVALQVETNQLVAESDSMVMECRALLDRIYALKCDVLATGTPP